MAKRKTPGDDANTVAGPATGDSVPPRTCKFDVSETAVLNAGARIINVQWGSDCGKRSSSTPGCSLVRSIRKEPTLQTQYQFPEAGAFRVACRAQDDPGGEALRSGEVDVK